VDVHDIVPGHQKSFSIMSMFTVSPVNVLRSVGVIAKWPPPLASSHQSGAPPANQVKPTRVSRLAWK
jgi:hypothetical protein